MNWQLVLTIAAAAMSAASLILHAIAPYTKTTVDDKAAEVIDEVKDLIPPAK